MFNQKTKPADVQERMLTTPSQLLAAGLIEEKDLAAVAAVARTFCLCITAQFVPPAAELNVTEEELHDPIGDEPHSPLPGIVHRYPDRVLLKPSTVCALYCRFCFRRETVGAGSQGLNDDELDAALASIASREEIWEVIISGGDPS